MFINMVEMLRNIQWMSEAEYSFLFFFYFFFFTLLQLPVPVLIFINRGGENIIVVITFVKN